MGDPYRDATVARFVQIAADMGDLFALDAEGRVWKWENTRWRRVKGDHRRDPREQE
jgi:hypothetical protein